MSNAKPESVNLPVLVQSAVLHCARRGANLEMRWQEADGEWLVWVCDAQPPGKLLFEVKKYSTLSDTLTRLLEKFVEES